MRSPPFKDASNDSVDDCDDIFGPPRTYPTGYCPPKNRPSMISAKYKQKEERRKVLKISLNKLKKIEDPEASLCRSVLINNTMRRLQKETRDEKLQKQQLNYPRCYDNDNYLNIKTEFLKNEKPFEDVVHNYESTDKIVDVVVENDFDAKLEEEIIKVSAKNIDVLDNLTVAQPDTVRLSSRKRSFDEIEDCDVQDVLSQFYMPPTPRMLTGIDDDEDVNVVDEEPLCKKLKESNELISATAAFEIIEPTRTVTTTTDITTSVVNTFLTNNNNRYGSPYADSDYSNSNSESNSGFSCGHASMFNELQSNVYHSLITSLET